jgi:hypothetical protein
MAEKKRLDVRALRDLAKKHLGAGYSKATREQLLVALKDVLGEVAAVAAKAKEATEKVVRKGVSRAKAVPGKVARGKKAAATPPKAAPAKEAPVKAAPVRKPAAKGKKAAAEPVPKAPPAVKAAARRAAAAVESVQRVEVTSFPPRARPEAVEVPAAPASQAAERPAARAEPAPVAAPPAPVAVPPAPAATRAAPVAAQSAAGARKGAEPARKVAEPVAPPSRSPAPAPAERPDVLVEGFFLTPEPRYRQTHAEPVGEGFFVARIAGEQAARLHGLADRSGHLPPGTFDEDLGELPVSYGEDELLALPRDPHSLFFFWDFGRGEGAASGAGRAVLRVYDGDELVREVEFAPETRRFYLHDLPAGRTYRLEAHLVAVDGSLRRVGEARLVTLPGEGPVRSAEVRFLKLPWHLALSRLREYLRDGRAQVEVVQGREAFTAWIRTPLPHSAELYEGIVSERAGLGEGLGETLGGWRPSPSGQRDLVK